MSSKPTKTVSFQLSTEEFNKLGEDAEQYSHLPRSGKSEYIRQALIYFKSYLSTRKEEPKPEAQQGVEVAKPV